MISDAKKQHAQDVTQDNDNDDSDTTENKDEEERTFPGLDQLRVVLAELDVRFSSDEME